MDTPRLHPDTIEEVKQRIDIIEEAGGKITAYDESPFRRETGRILATNGQIHSPLSQALQKAASGRFQFESF